MLIETFTSRFMQTNTYVVSCDHTRRALLIDPFGKVEQIADFVKARQLKVVGIVNTHTHADHVWGNHAAKKAFGAPILVHEAESRRLARVGPAAWIKGHWKLSPPADRILKDGDEIQAGSLRFKVIHTPGHSPGGICLRYKKAIFTGDTLFRGSVGRTDLKGGNFNQLAESIKERLFILSDDIFCYPGHGPRTSIRDERKYNIFVRISPEQMERILFGPGKKEKAGKVENDGEKSKGSE